MKLRYAYKRYIYKYLLKSETNISPLLLNTSLRLHVLLIMSLCFIVALLLQIVLSIKAKILWNVLQYLFKQKYQQVKDHDHKNSKGNEIQSLYLPHSSLNLRIFLLNPE